MAQGSSNGNINAITATIEVGETHTLDEGLARVENVGNEKHAILDFYLPRGLQGEQGEQGEQGIQGVQGEQGERGLKGDSALVVNNILTISPLISSFHISITYFNKTPQANETFLFLTHYTISSQDKSFLCIGKVNSISSDNVYCSITNYIDATGIQGADGRDGADLEIDDNTPSAIKVYSSVKVNAIKEALEQAIAQIVIPTAVSDLNNDLVFQTETQVANAINVLAQTIASYDYASKSFVNSTVNSLTAFFRGSFATKALLLAYTGEKTNNDYAYVEQDETHNNEAWRYIYVIPSGQTTGSWQAQFKVNDTPFTQAQLNALNSGITQDLISTIQSAISGNTSAIQGKQNTITSSNKLSFDLLKDLPTLLKGATVSGNTLTLKFIDNTTVAFTPTFTETHVGDVVALTFGTGLSNGGTATNPKVQIASGYKLPTTTEWNNKANTSAIPTDNTQLANGMGYLTAITSAMITTALGYTPYSASNPNGYTSNVGTITGIKMNGASKGNSGVVDLGTVITAHQDISGKANSSDLGAVAFSNSYNDLNNKPSIPSALSDLSGDTTHRTVSDTEKSTWNGKSNFSGSYTDLTNKPTIPSALSQLTGDATHRVVTDTEKNTWNNKSDFSGSYNDLTDKPTIPTANHLYQHNIYYFSTRGSYKIYLSFTILNDSSTAITTFSGLISALNGQGELPASGCVYEGTDNPALSLFKAGSSSVTVYYIKSGTKKNDNITTSSSNTITDTVKQIF